MREYLKGLSMPEAQELMEFSLLTETGQTSQVLPS